MKYTITDLKKIETWAERQGIKASWIDSSQLRLDIGTEDDPIGLHYDVVWDEPLIGFCFVSDLPKILSVTEAVQQMLKA